MMGDRNPKSINKQNSQKQAKTDKSNKVKQEAVFARQSTSKKT